MAKYWINFLFLDGKNGMGQAQSQSMGGDCTDCHSSRESKSG